MKKVVLVELYLSENADSQNVLASLQRIANKDEKQIVTHEDHDNLGTITGVRKIHETFVK